MTNKLSLSSKNLPFAIVNPFPAIIVAAVALALTGCGGSGDGGSGEYVVDSVSVYRSESGPAVGYLEYDYDDEGNTVSIESYQYQDDGTELNTYSYDYIYDADNRVIYSREYTPSIGNETEQDSIECAMSYVVGKEQASRTEYCQYLWEGEEDGVTRSVTAYSATAIGYSLSTAVYSANSADDELLFDSYSVVQYDAQGNSIVEMEFEDYEGTLPVSEVRYSYNTSGFLVLEQSDYDYDGTIDASIRYEGDSAGNVLLSSTDSNMDGIADEEVRSTFDDNGRLHTVFYDGLFDDDGVNGVVDLKLVYEWREL